MEIRKMFNKKSITTLSVIIGIIVIGGIAVILATQKTKPVTPPSMDNTQTSNQTDQVMDKENDQATTTAEIINFDIGMSDWLTYRNEEFGFELRYPGNYKLCLNDFCINEENDSRIQFAELNAVGSSYRGRYKIQIRPLVNLLNESAIDFAEKIKKYNEQEKQYIKNSGREVDFSNHSAYQFDVQIGFNERGLLIYPEGAKPGNGYSGELLDGIHRIIYFDKGKFMFRVIYPLDDLTAEAFISSLDLF